MKKRTKALTPLDQPSEGRRYLPGDLRYKGPSLASTSASFTKPISRKEAMPINRNGSAQTSTSPVLPKRRQKELLAASVKRTNVELPSKKGLNNNANSSSKINEHQKRAQLERLRREQILAEREAQKQQLLREQMREEISLARIRREERMRQQLKQKLHLNNNHNMAPKSRGYKQPR